MLYFSVLGQHCDIRDTVCFDLRFDDVDVAFVLGSFCLGLGLDLEGCWLVNNIDLRAKNKLWLCEKRGCD